jgi:hypothetical protein
MVTPGLTFRRFTLAAGGVLGATLLGALLAVIDPASAGHTAPHPALNGTAGDAVSILANNTTVLAVPYVLWALGLPCHRIGRRLGDVAVATITGQSTLPVGIALAHWRAGLLPYIPQLPLEWAALSTTVAAWLRARDGHPTARALPGLAAITLVLLTAGASLETWATPHRDTPPAASARRRVDTTRDPRSTVGAGGCPRHGFCTGDGQAAARSRAPFPSRSSVPLGRLAGADRAPSTHRPPQGGIT